MKTIGILIGAALLLTAGVVIWNGTMGPGGAPGRIEAAKAAPSDFYEACAAGAELKSRSDPAWAGAQAIKAPPIINRSERPQEVTCKARWRDGSEVTYQIRVMCGAGSDCVNVL